MTTLEATQSFLAALDGEGNMNELQVKAVATIYSVGDYSRLQQIRTYRYRLAGW